MRCRLRTLLVALALGLVLLELGLFMLPDGLNLPGGMLTWLMLVAVFWYGIPLALILTLAAAIVVQCTDAYAKEAKTVELSPMFRFTIRDVLWLTALVAVLFGWHVDRRIMVAQYYDLHKRLYESQLREYRPSSPIFVGDRPSASGR
jgi:hypothetical protein